MKKLKSIQLIKELVFEELKKDIINGVFLPGAKLKEEDIARTLGVSRTPVREAINRLEREGFVKLIPQRGAYVATVTETDVEEIFILRESLEGLAARLSAPKMTDQLIAKLKTCVQGLTESKGELALFQEYSKKNALFHQTILRVSGSERLFRIASELFDYSQSFLLSPLGFYDRFKVYLKQHKEIIQALTEKDSILAEKLMSDHISRVRDGVLNNIELFLKVHSQSSSNNLSRTAEKGPAK